MHTRRTVKHRQHVRTRSRAPKAHTGAPKQPRKLPAALSASETEVLRILRYHGGWLYAGDIALATGGTLNGWHVGKAASTLRKRGLVKKRFRREASDTHQYKAIPRPKEGAT